MKSLFKKIGVGAAVCGLAASSFGATNASATSDAPGGIGGLTIADLVVQASSLDGFDSDRNDFDVLLAALQAAGLVEAVANPDAELTVLAPNDYAFIKLARSLGYQSTDEAEAWAFLADALAELGGGDPIPVLTDVLLYHVAAGETRLVDLVRGAEVETLLGPSISAPDGRVFVDADPDNVDAAIIKNQSNRIVSNGVVHTIDRVLLPVDLDNRKQTRWENPKTIAEFAIATSSDEGFDRRRGDYDILLAALGAAGLVDVVADPTAELTVFAPTDAAFVRLARDLGYSGHDEAGAWTFLVGALTELGGGDPIPVLTNVLLYHVAGGELSAADVLGSKSVETVLGVDIGVGEGRTLVDAEPDLADPKLILRKSDVELSNGVFHSVSRVLIPVDLP